MFCSSADVHIITVSGNPAIVFPVKAIFLMKQNRCAIISGTLVKSYASSLEKEMPVFQDVPETALVELVFDQYNQTVENTLHVSWTDDTIVSSLMLADIAEWTAGWWNAEMKDLTSNAVTLREVRATSLAEEFGPQSVYIAGYQGGFANPGLPGNVTMCVSFRTAKRGRNFRGRNYFVGLYESAVSGNTISGSVLANVAAGFATYQTYLDDSPQNVDWTVVSRKTEKITRPFGVHTKVTDVVIVDAFTDSMRGRLTGRGA